MRDRAKAWALLGPDFCPPRARAENAGVDFVEEGKPWG